VQYAQDKQFPMTLMTTPLTGIESWTEFLAEGNPPILRRTSHSIAQARERIACINVREIAGIVLHDPMMTARVLRFSAVHRGRRQLQDLSTVEHAVMMLGVEPFFHHFAEFDVIEDRLQPQALLGLLQVIRRAQRAAHFALEWATWRCDLNCEEVAVAALLHDLAEMLVWCRAPEQALHMQAMRKEHPTRRSADVHMAVLGFPLHELQILVCQKWELPNLLLTLMDDASSAKPRVKNVKLAVDLARHSAHGWDDPALPDDYKAIAALMNIDLSTLRSRLGLNKPAEGAAPESPGV
jgi:HD-like signal output (HDOD) protein